MLIWGINSYNSYKKVKGSNTRRHESFLWYWIFSHFLSHRPETDCRRSKSCMCAGDGSDTIGQRSDASLPAASRPLLLQQQMLSKVRLL